MPSFQRDVKKAPKEIVVQLNNIFSEIIQAKSIAEIPKIKKLSGYKGAYRIRIDDYRLGLLIENDIATLVRLLSRKDVYKYFP
jgi:mRNA interferase RelE/StbE